MKKKSVNLITAVGVLVVLSGAYVGVKTYVAKQDAEEAEADEEESQEIISIASDDVKSVKFVMDKKEVTFEKDGDSWVKSEVFIIVFKMQRSFVLRQRSTRKS